MNGNSLRLAVLLLLIISGIPAPGFSAAPPADTTDPIVVDIPDTPADNSGQLTISNINPANYKWDTLEIGKPMFIDVDYGYTEIPAKYAGMDQIVTAKEDRTSAGDNFMSFEVNIPVTVYVAHLDRITDKPAWLQSWADTGDDIVFRTIFRKDFDAGTITLGGNTVDGVDIRQGSMYMVLVEPLSDDIPVASHDVTSTEPNTAVNINILSNDKNLYDTPLTILINAPPINGRIIIEPDNTLTYIPNNNFTGDDSLIYEVTDNNGDRAIASVSINVRCSTCLIDAFATLSWDPNPDDILGYTVYVGPTVNNVTQLASTLPLTSGLLNPASPSVQFHLGNDLGLAQGDSICFRLKAYNGSGFSDFSSAACFDALN